MRSTSEWKSTLGCQPKVVRAFVAVVAIPQDDLLLRVESALVAGSIGALVVFAVVLRILIHTGAQPDEDSLMEAFDSLPMEP